MTPAKQATKRQPPTPEQIRAQQSRDAEKEHAASTAVVPAPASTAVAAPDNRTSLQKYTDEVAPASIVGCLVKFAKDGTYVTTDDDAVIGDDVDFVALCDQTMAGWIRFNDDRPPDRIMGLVADGFELPKRETLGDADQAQWARGLDGKPQDPWVHQSYLVLQRGDSGELFTFATSSITGRRAVGNLLRHYDRLQKQHADVYPVVRLKVGGFQHRDERVGFVKIPVFAVVGKAPKDSAAKPDSSVAADLNDQIPW